MTNSQMISKWWICHNNICHGVSNYYNWVKNQLPVLFCERTNKKRVTNFWQAQHLFSSKKRIKRLMDIYQLVFISILDIQFRNESISINNTTSSLLCCHQFSKQCISKLTIAVYCQQNRSMGDQVFHCYIQNENLEWICMNFE